MGRKDDGLLLQVSAFHQGGYVLRAHVTNLGLGSNPQGSFERARAKAALIGGGQQRRGIEPQQPLSRVGYWLTALSTRLFARTVAVSDGLLAHIVTHWRARPEKCLRVYNPVAAGAGADTAPTRPLAGRAPVALSVGRLVAYKNFPLLLRAFAQAEPKTAKLIILGEGPERPAIDAEIARLGLADRVILAGYVAEPWPFYAQADCFALASNFESFGLVIVEALAHGLPVVATASDGPAEILRGGEFGALVPHHDATALATALSRAFADRGDPAPRRARARDFSVDAALDAYAALFEAVIAAPDAGVWAARVCKAR